MQFFRRLVSTLLALAFATAPAYAARPIVDLHSLDAYFALFAQDSNVPWKSTTVRLDTYSGTPVDFSIYQVNPGDVLTASSNARPRAISTRGRRPVARFRYSPPGGYQFESNEVALPLGNRAGFFVVEARRGNVGEQVWINRTDIGLLAKETPRELMLYGADLHTGQARSGMRVQFVVNRHFVTRKTNAHGVVTWTGEPRPIFALAQWGASYAFVSLLPQAPLPSTIVGMRTASAVVHAGGSVDVIGFARTRSATSLRVAHGDAIVSLRRGGTLIGERRVALDAAGAFTATFAVPSAARAGDYAVIAQVGGGVGSASVHVDADADGLSLRATSKCENACDPNADVPIEITSSRGGVPVHVAVVRSPHVFIGYTPSGTAWATTQWLDRTVSTDAQGRAQVLIPKPTDGLASTYGVRVTSGGATADTRIVVPTAPVAVRLHLDRIQQTLGTPVDFDIYANHVGSGKPLGETTVIVQLAHGASVQQQRLVLDAQGHARGAFSSPNLGSNLVFATVNVGGKRAMDAAEVQVVPQAIADAMTSGSGSVTLSLNRAMYRDGEEIHANASLPGAYGDALMTLESGENVSTAIVRTVGGRAATGIKAVDAPGNLRIGAAFVRNAALDWTSTPLALDAPGRPNVIPLSIKRVDGIYTAQMDGALAGGGTTAVRVSRGDPSGSALFDTAPALLAVGVAATQISAPSGTTWHPWVDSTGAHPHILGFVRRSAPPPDLTIAQSDAVIDSWSISHLQAPTLPLNIPTQAGRYTVSILKIAIDGRVTAATAAVVVP